MSSSSTLFHTFWQKWINFCTVKWEVYKSGSFTELLLIFTLPCSVRIPTTHPCDNILAMCLSVAYMIFSHWNIWPTSKTSYWNPGLDVLPHKNVKIAFNKDCSIKQTKLSRIFQICCKFWSFFFLQVLVSLILMPLKSILTWQRNRGKNLKSSHFLKRFVFSVFGHFWSVCSFLHWVALWAK